MSRGEQDLTGLSKDGSVRVTNEVINSISHLAAACLAVLGAALLIVGAAVQADVWKIVSFSIYGFALVSLFVFSTLHHSINASTKTNQLLRTIDYVTVFLMIAGTVTPLVLILYRNAFGWTVLGSVWVIATVGIVLRAVHASLPKYVTNTLYITLGWLPVALIADGNHLSEGGLSLLVAGGVLYSLGFAVYILEKPNPKRGIFGFHELWHIIVVLAAACHYALMYRYVLGVTS